jgi:maltose O-acetyltransferase
VRSVSERLSQSYDDGRLARLERRIELLRWRRWQIRYPGLRGTGPIRLGRGSHIMIVGEGRIVVERDVLARPDLTISTRGLVHLGEGVFLGRSTNIACYKRITIGAQTQLAERVSVHDSNHVIEPVSDISGRHDEILAAPVTIGARVWLATNVVVLPGVTIGDDTVVGAGSVVTSDLPPGVLAVGAPARVLRQLTP